MKSIIKGSVMDVTIDGDTASALANVRRVLVCDVSQSMSAKDIAGNKSRYAIEKDTVETFQRNYPGQIGIVSFSDAPNLCLDGILPSPSGSTSMIRAIEFVLPLMEAGIPTTLISDGEPDFGTEDMIISIVSRLDEGVLSTIYIGEAGSIGERFMKRLSSAGGGEHDVIQTVIKLPDVIERLLLTSG
jgi:hypothetical protein